MNLYEILREIEKNLDSYTIAELKQFNENFLSIIQRKLNDDLKYFTKGSASSTAVQRTLVNRSRKRAAPKFEGYFLSPDSSVVWAKWSQGRFPNAFRNTNKSDWIPLSEEEFTNAAATGKQVAKATLGYDANHSTLESLIEKYSHGRTNQSTI